MGQAIAFLLLNFTLTLLVIGLIVSALSLLRRPRPWTRAEIVEAVLSWFLFFSLGVSNLYNFVMHVYSDILLPVFGLALLRMQRREHANARRLEASALPDAPASGRRR